MSDITSQFFHLVHSGKALRAASPFLKDYLTKKARKVAQEPVVDSRNLAKATAEVLLEIKRLTQSQADQKKASIGIAAAFFTALVHEFLAFHDARKASSLIHHANNMLLSRAVLQELWGSNLGAERESILQAIKGIRGAPPHNHHSVSH